MNWCDTLPQDIIEYICVKLYNEFTNEIKKKYQIKKDAIFVHELLTRERFYIENIYNINNLHNNNYNSFSPLIGILIRNADIKVNYFLQYFFNKLNIHGLTKDFIHVAGPRFLDELLL